MEPLGRYEEHFWPSEPEAYGTGRARRGGVYDAFVPAKIAGLSLSFSDVASAAMAVAARALVRLTEDPPRIARLGSVAQNLLRSESVASSRIEGVSISHKRLARAEYEGIGRADGKAAEVLGNVEAMQRAISLAEPPTAFEVKDILEIHRTLLCHTEDRDIAGVIREKQNWIGGNDYNPVGATYVPPPPGYVPELMEDLCRFIERTDLPPVAQAAIAHAQFENIHPFADGNGRTGRALIYAVLRRREEIKDYVPPISLVLGARPKTYVNGFGAYSGGDVSSWCEVFAEATGRAAEAAVGFARHIEERQQDWLERLGQPRGDAAVRQLVAALPEQPVIDIATGQRITAKSHVAVGNAMRQLVDAGILRPLNERRWGRVWECDELLDLVDEFERSLALTV